MGGVRCLSTSPVADRAQSNLAFIGDDGVQHLPIVHRHVSHQDAKRFPDAFPRTRRLRARRALVAVMPHSESMPNNDMLCKKREFDALTVPKIEYGKLMLATKDLAKIVEAVISDAEGDDLKIITGEGKVYQLGKLVLKKGARVATFGTTVSHHQAWEEMEIYFDELRLSGALEE